MERCGLVLSALARDLQHTQRHMFARRLPKPVGQLDISLGDAVVTILCNRPAPRALAEDGEVFPCHKQTIFSRFHDLMFQFVHRVGVRQTIG